MARVEEFTGREKMLEDWNRVLVAILRANEGECDIRHVRNEDDEVIGIVAELLLQFEDAVSEKLINNYEKAVRVAKQQLGDLVTKEGEFTSKQRMIIDWMSMKNAIIRAQSGEMKIALHKSKAVSDFMVGASVEVVLNFDRPLSETFTGKEKATIDESKDKHPAKE